MGAGPANILFGSEVNIWINRADIRQQIYGAPLLFCAGSHALHITSQRSVIAQIFTRTSHGRYQGAHAVRAGLVCKSHPEWEGEKEISEKKVPPPLGGWFWNRTHPFRPAANTLLDFTLFFLKLYFLFKHFSQPLLGQKCIEINGRS